MKLFWNQIELMIARYHKHTKIYWIVHFQICWNDNFHVMCNFWQFFEEEHSWQIQILKASFGLLDPAIPEGNPDAKVRQQGMSFLSL